MRTLTHSEQRLRRIVDLAILVIGNSMLALSVTYNQNGKVEEADLGRVFASNLIFLAGGLKFYAFGRLAPDRGDEEWDQA